VVFIGDSECSVTCRSAHRCHEVRFWRCPGPAAAGKSKAKPAAASSAPAGADEPTKEDRDRHLAAVANPNVKPVRSTVDLSPVRHRQLKAWCGETAEMIGKSRVTTQDVFRAFVDRLITDESLARNIRDDLRAANQ
jgi:hypothetical protein